MARYLTPHHYEITAEHRKLIKNQQPVIIWMTGLSASGKSTIASELDKLLIKRNYHTFILDGDNLRLGLCKDLGFSEADRTENIRRCAEVASLLANAGLIVICSFISPNKSDRNLAKETCDEHCKFIEVFVDTPIQTCVERDPKGLYRKAISGEIQHFTGISAPYDLPDNPDIHIQTNSMTAEYAAEYIFNQIEEQIQLIEALPLSNQS